MQTLDIKKIYSVKEEQEQYTRMLQETDYREFFSDIEASIEYDDFQFAYLSQLYTIEEADSVKSFINEHPYLTKILFEAPDRIYSIFGKVTLYLELHHDYEEDWEELFIIIKSSYSSKEARRFMDKLGETWFLDIIPLVGNKLCITEEPT